MRLKLQSAVLIGLAIFSGLMTAAQNQTAPGTGNQNAVTLATLGYVHMPHADDAFCPFFHRPAEWPHTHHVHVVRAGGEEERRTLAFRDYLREHNDVARQYAELKREFAAVTDATDASSREAYATAKSEFVERVSRMALAAGYPRGFSAI